MNRIGTIAKCAIRKHGEILPGVTTVTLERNGLTLVVKSVPARECVLEDIRAYAPA